MGTAFYLADDSTLASALAFGPTAAGATSAAQILHLWQSKGTPGGLLTNMSVQATTPRVEGDPTTGLDHGVNWLDETWLEVRVNGGANPGQDPAFVRETTDWFKLGPGLRLPLRDLPGNCAAYIEVRLHPPLKDGTADESVNFQLNAIQGESVLSLAGALSDLGQGIVTGIGDRTASEWIDAPAVTASGTPDDVVNVSGPRTYLANGTQYVTTADDDLTLDQNDGAAAALTTGQEYKAIISQPPGIEEASVATKGLLATTGAAVTPAMPAGNVLIALVLVKYHATASVIEQTDITGYAAGGRFAPSVGTGLTVNVAAGRAILSGARIVNRSARVVAVPASDDSWIWLSSSDALTVTDSDVPPFAGALPLAAITTDGSGVTALTDLRVYWQVGGWGLGLQDLADNAAAIAAGLAPGQFYRTTDAVKVVH